MLKDGVIAPERLVDIIGLPLRALDDGGAGEFVTQVTDNAYACPDVATHDRRARPGATSR